MHEQPAVIDAIDQIVIKFRQPTEHGEYSDALYFTREEYAKLSEADIEAMIATRVSNWIAVITAPRAEPTEEEKTAQVDVMKQQQLATQEQILRSVPDDEAEAIIMRQQEILAEQLEQIKRRRAP